ncbi:MAG: ubiquitin-like small modifier protein 1 [Anaerolineales bacterium]
MKIKVFATLREIVGEKSFDLPVDSTVTVGEVLEQVIQRYPGLRSELLDEEGQLLGRVHLLINGRDVRFLESEFDTLVSNADVISIFPAVGGGLSTCDDDPTDTSDVQNSLNGDR